MLTQRRPERRRVFQDVDEAIAPELLSVTVSQNSPVLAGISSSDHLCIPGSGSPYIAGTPAILANSGGGGGSKNGKNKKSQEQQKNNGEN
jgi:hypothetical protein